MDRAPALLGWLALHLAIGAAGTWMAWRYALRRNLVDQPGERRSHVVATPRGGGISLVVSMLAALGLLAVWGGEGWVVPAFMAGVGLVAVGGIGWADDHRPLSPWWRLAVHAVAAAWLAAAIHTAGGDPWQAAMAFTAALVLVNVWNFMDGIDGLAASQAGLVALGYALLSGAGAPLWLGLAVAAAVCGFLPFNAPRARIFLGDVGSGALGYAMAGLLSLSLLASEPDWTWLALFLPLFPFLVDASLTLGSRILRGERWWEPHVQHAYQRWVQAGSPHWVVTGAYALATVTCITVVFAVHSLSAPVQLGIITGAWLAGGCIWWRLRGAS
jgi:UDP-N-acetylmuramyl pentapeptide phosphotransferase/UDP-N-acetylglucosamine-1-phosphate transferase